MSVCAGFPYTTGGAYSNHGASANLNITGELTIDAWIKFVSNPISGGTRHLIFIRGNPGASGYCFGIGQASLVGRHYLSFSNYGGGVFADATLAKIQEGKLCHVAVTWDNVTNIRFYVDGVLMQTIVNPAALVGVATNAYISWNTIGDAFKGCIYNLNIYNRLLSATEILYNKEHPNNAIRRGRQLGVTQESIIGGVWKDLSPNGYDGTFTNTIIGPSNNLAGRNALV
jgi:hypothetical protein